MKALTPITWFDTIDSTNSEARRRAESAENGNIDNMSVYAARFQTAGRGQRGNKWTSAAGENLTFSILLYPGKGGNPKVNAIGQFCLSIVSSLSVIDFLSSKNVQASIKWPNDIFIGSRKLSGILCEGVVRKGALAGIICGIGVNVNLPESALASIGQPATSLLAQTKREIDLKIFAEKLAVYLNWYYIIGINDRESLYSLWKRENRIIGQRVMLLPPHGEAYEALAKDITPEGKLLVEELNGAVREFACGDVKILPGGGA